MKKNILSITMCIVSFVINVQAQSNNYFGAPQNCYAEIYNYSNLVTLQTGTISFWFRIDDLTQSNIFFSTSNKNAIGTNNEFYIVYRQNEHLIQTASVVNGDVKMDAWLPVNSTNDTDWHNYTLVADNSGSIQIYLDGLSQTLTAGTCCGGTLSEYFLGDVPNVNNMKIGALERDIFHYSNAFSMDNFRIWNTALSSSEVASLATYSVPAAANVLLYYSFEQIENLSIGNSGNNDVADQTSYNQNADLVNNCTIETSGPSNHVFGAPQNCYAEVYNYNNLISLQTGTISFWFRIDNLTQSNVFFSTSNKNAIGTNNEFYIVYRQNEHLIQTASVVNGDVKMDAWLPVNSTNDTDWHNYTLVADNSGSIQIYLDGLSQTLTAGTCCGGTLSEYFLGDVPNVNNMKIGALERDIFHYSNAFSMDNFRIWNTALSSSEVADLNSFQSIPAPGNILLYYSFEQMENLSIGSSGINDIADQTGNNQNADLANSCTLEVGIENTFSENEQFLNAYPNPVKDLLTLSLNISGNITVQIIDPLGRECFRTSEMATTTGFFKVIDLSELQSGYYTISVKTKGVIIHRRIIKQ